MSTMRIASIRGCGGSTPNRLRGLAALDTAPELALSRDQKVLIERVGVDLDFNPLAAAGDDRQRRRLPPPHILCWSCGMCFSVAASSEIAQGSMNLDSKTAPVYWTPPSSVAAIHVRSDGEHASGYR